MDWARLGALLAIALVGCGASRRSSVDSRTDDGGTGPVAASAGEGGAAVTAGGDGGLVGSPPEGAAGTLVSAGFAGAGGAGTALDPVGAMAAWRTRLAVAHCARDQRCGPLWSSTDDCLEDAGTWPAYVRFFAGIDQDEYLASTHTLADAALLDACVAAVTGTPCDDARSSYEACLRVLVPKAPREDGEPCAYDSPYILAPACAPGLVCSEPYSCGVCVPLPPARAEGERCSSGDDCESGLVCLASTCRAASALAAAGEPCAGAASCQGGFTCALDSRVCVRLAGEDEPCEPGAYACMSDLTCVTDAVTGSSTCRAYARRGDVCPRVSTAGDTQACNRSNWCVFATPDAPTGTCGVAPPMPGPCALFANDSSYFCPAGTYADSDADDELAPPAACICKPAVELGARCQSDAQCAEGYCGADRDGDSRRCVPLLPDGAVCAPNDLGHCASLHGCDAATGTCGAACANPFGP